MFGQADEEQPLNFGMNIKDASQEVRRAFVGKVYGILSAQLLLTVAVAAPLQTVSVLWLQQHQWILYVSVIMSLVTILSMVCCRSLSRKFPQNYILLFLFTAFEGVLVGFVSAMYTWQSVVLAAGITVAIFLAMTAFAFYTSTDFTGFGPYLFAFLITFCMFGFTLAILSMCGVQVQWMYILYDVLGVLLFTFYIVFDTQMILGEWGGHKVQFSVDDYVFAALNLYLDIINLFLHILALVGKRK